jgi:hypothetical protein
MKTEFHPNRDDASMHQLSYLRRAICAFFVFHCIARFLGMESAACGQVPNQNVHRQNEENEIAKVFDAKTLVESLANRNTPPTIVGERGEQEPLFGSNYDWKEQDRIRKLINLLAIHAEEAWPELVKHLDDKRYCITYAIDERPCNLTIASVCNMIIKDSLAQAYRIHLPTRHSENAFVNMRPESVVPIRLKEWCEQNRTKRLYELQLEICERAIVTFANMDKVDKQINRLTREEEHKAIADMKAESESLRKSKTALAIDRFGVGIGVEVYSDKRAENIRRRHQLESPYAN